MIQQTLKIIKNYLSALKGQNEKQQDQIDGLERKFNVIGGLHDNLFDQFNTHLIELHDYKECDNCNCAFEEVINYKDELNLCKDCYIRKTEQ